MVYVKASWFVVFFGLFSFIRRVKVITIDESSFVVNGNFPVVTRFFAFSFLLNNILKAIPSNEGTFGMGSTVVALQDHGTHFEVAWVGDSRAYLWSRNTNGGQLEQLTTDHSYVQRLIDTGAISADEISQHPDRHIITQCLGSKKGLSLTVDNLLHAWQPGQRILLCSDGLTDEVSDQCIAEILGHTSTPQLAAQQLIDLALEQGGRDNITVQVIDVVGDTVTADTYNKHVRHTAALGIIVLIIIC